MAGGDKTRKEIMSPTLTGDIKGFYSDRRKRNAEIIIDRIVLYIFSAGNAYAEDYNDIFWGMLKENQEIVLSVATVRH